MKYKTLDFMQEGTSISGLLAIHLLGVYFPHTLNLYTTDTKMIKIWPSDIIAAIIQSKCEQEQKHNKM